MSDSIEFGYWNRTYSIDGTNQRTVFEIFSSVLDLFTVQEFKKEYFSSSDRWKSIDCGKMVKNWKKIFFFLENVKFCSIDVSNDFVVSLKLNLFCSIEWRIFSIGKWKISNQNNGLVIISFIFFVSENISAKIKKR